MSQGKMTLASLVFALSFSVCAINSLAQNPPPHQRQQLDASQVTVVDGAQHSELIPDATAYRLYLLTVSTSPNPADEERTRKNAHLGMIRLQDKDRQQLAIVLTDFKSQYASLIGRYNDTAAAAQANGQRSDPTLLFQQRDDLVQATRDALKRALSADGMLRLDTYVKNQKRSMKMYTKKEGQ